MIQKVKSLLQSQKLLSFASNGIGAVLGLASFALLARTLSKSELGVWAIFMAVSTLSDMLRNGWVGKPLIKFYASQEKDSGRREILGTAWYMGITASIVLGVIVTVVFVGIAYWSHNDDYYLYAVFFLPLVLFNLPMNMSRWVLNAKIRFDQMMWLRIFLQSIFFIGIGLEYYYDFGLWFIFMSYVAASFSSSAITLIKGWGQITTLPHRSKSTRQQLASFGKYSMGSQISGSLLRSSDTFIIGIFMGERAVALYEVPMRLVNLIDIPLRALVSYSFPMLSGAFRQKSQADFQEQYERAVGFAFLLLLPVALLTFVFAETLVVWMGGEEYREAALIMRMFSIYMGFTAIDRYVGVGLDVVNRPRRNYYKVLVMLAINVLGDLAVVQLTDEVHWVAFVTIFTFSGGAIYGSYYLHQFVKLSPVKIVLMGFKEIQKIVNNLVSK